MTAWRKASASAPVSIDGCSRKLDIRGRGDLLFPKGKSTPVRAQCLCRCVSTACRKTGHLVMKRENEESRCSNW
jgi:hypothetical protein